MALLDRFKKSAPSGKKEEEKKEPVEKAEIKDVQRIKEDYSSDGDQSDSEKIKPASGQKIEKPARGGSAQGRKEFSQVAAKVLRSPHVTEKAINLNQQNKYVFKVEAGANKNEVKRAIHELYGVKVEDVNVLNIPRKREGWAGAKGLNLASGRRL